MSIWLDGVTVTPAPSDGGSMVGGPPRGVLHTTEGSTASGAIAAMRQANTWSHITATFEGNRFHAWQHIPLDRAARALRNPPGGVQTNRQGSACVQIEVVGFAQRADQLPPAYLAGLAALMRQVEQATGIPRRSSVTWKAYPASFGANGVRLSGAAWNGYSGWLGHQHVPENDHGDPGLIDINALLSGPPQEDDVTKDDVKDALREVLGISAGGKMATAVFGQVNNDQTLKLIAAKLDAIAAKLPAAPGADAETIAALVAGQLEIKGMKATAGGEISITFGPPTP